MPHFKRNKEARQRRKARDCVWSIEGSFGSSGSYNVREEKSELWINCKHQRLGGAWYGSKIMEMDRVGYGFDNGHVTGQSTDFLSPKKPCGLPILAACGHQ